MDYRETPPSSSEIPESPEEKIRRLEKELAFTQDVLMAADALVDSRGYQLAAKDRIIAALEQERATDKMTGLPNELGLQNFSENRRKRREPGHAVLMYLDANRFKEINDTLGHRAGDEVIRGIGEYLKKITRSESDTVVHLHGDEFVVVFEGTTEEEIAKKFENGKLAFSAAYGGDKAIEVSLSAGVTDYAAHEPLADVMQRADAAMYRAKKTGDGNVQRYAVAPEAETSRTEQA